MSRSNTSASLAQWHQVAPSAPYRASIDAASHWDVGLPSPDLIDASRISPGGRQLLAFQLAEVRDYFVEGHSHQGAQKEPDWCERASSRRDTSNSVAPSFSSLDVAIETLIAAQKLTAIANNEIERQFNTEVSRLLSLGRPEDALKIILSMPNNHLRSIAVETVLKSGQWDFNKNPMWKLDASPYTRERATAMLQWQKSDKDLKSVEDVYGEMVMTRAREILDTEGNDAVEAFKNTLPRSVTKAFVADMAKYGKPSVKDEASGPKM